MAKRDKNRSFKDWEDEWGTPDISKKENKRDRRDQRIIKQQPIEDWSVEDGE